MTQGRKQSGTLSPRISQLLKSMDNELPQGLVPLWIYNDQEVYETELEQIFGRSWIFMAHETEIPNKSDYVVRSIGDDPFIVVRGSDDRIRVLFDSCRHRGSRVCQADKGNTNTFLCPYHGWSYKNTGEIDAIPNRKTAFKGIDESQWGLIPAPRVEAYRGLVFASLDENAKPLTEHLGAYRWYLDIHLGLTPGGMQVVGEPHRWQLDADWKSGSENFSGDSYHTQSLHQSVVRIGFASPAAGGASGGKNDIHVIECDGHATSIRRKDEGYRNFWGYPPELIALFTCEGLSKEQRELAERSVTHTGTIFPNLSLIHIGLTDVPGTPDTAYFSLRQWCPLGPGRMEVRSWVLVPKEASEQHKAKAYKVAAATFGSAGNFEQDDSVAWSGVARSAAGKFAKSQGLLLNYQMGMEGMSEAKVLPEWPGPGIAYDSNLEEGVQRTFFNHWHRAMSRGTGAGAST